MKKHSYPFSLLRVAALCSTLLSASGCTLFQGAPVFEKPQFYGEAHEWRMYPIVVDMNGDGNPDIVATHRRPLSENSLHIFRGSPQGTFREEEPNWTSPGYSGIASGDINGDGKPDLICASHFTRVHTYLSKPNGSFEEHVMPTTDGYVAARLADLDRDGQPEAVLLGNEHAGIEVYKWDKKANWILKSSLLAGNNIGRDLQVADMNNDGRLDIVASFLHLGVVIFLQGEHGEWDQAPETGFFSATEQFRNLALVDINQDGFLDIALNGSFAGIAKPNGPDVYFSNGKAAGWTPELDGLKVIKNATEGLAVADFNQDGFLDIITGGNITGTVKERAFGLFMFSGDGKGHWHLEKNSGLPETGVPRPYGIAAHDLNRDRVPDLVVTHSDPEEGFGFLSVWLSKPKSH